MSRIYRCWKARHGGARMPRGSSFFVSAGPAHPSPALALTRLAQLCAASAPWVRTTLKVAGPGASGGTGQPLSRLLKNSPLVSHLMLYNTAHYILSGCRSEPRSDQCDCERLSETWAADRLPERLWFGGYSSWSPDKTRQDTGWPAQQQCHSGGPGCCLSPALPWGHDVHPFKSS